MFRHRCLTLVRHPLFHYICHFPRSSLTNPTLEVLCGVTQYRRRATTLIDALGVLSADLCGAIGQGGQVLFAVVVAISIGDGV
ncbi:hypothetical protein BDU57DRAFT_346103 [Ampelomyces quisqualis]|uniref:Uncharacterized protein n=1 Tax=Ampelomyces quisqualis TaxID=50730 RepID=A0A6A5QEB3_AMPQU|nr:hypothetical protein BDU57DRAFT_346103 [Ampelomyces quisqualis]